MGIRLQLPRLKLEYELTMNEAKALGMRNAISDSADFTRIYGPGGLFISKVKHKTFVKVDEKGTAAAVTSVEIMRISLPPSMTVGRPFIFVIRERTSGTIMFMGKIVGPVWEEG